jgi:hypothetical protein
MAIKYLKGIYSDTRLKDTRPRGLRFPLGLKLVDSDIKGANTSSGGTFDVLLVAGGGAGGGTQFAFSGGGGGAGGVRILSSNTFTDVYDFNQPNIENIPVVVGGSGGNSCFGLFFTACRGGGGGGSNGGGGPGGSGGGAGSPTSPSGSSGPAGIRSGGAGVFGQGCNGEPNRAWPTPTTSNYFASGYGGSALANASNTSGVTSSFTGVAVRYGDGGNRRAEPVAANIGKGGSGQCSYNGPSLAGGSGIVAVRYRNTSAPTTPIATGGNCICCTGGCIIHIFTSSGFLNITSPNLLQFDIN